MKVLVLSLKKIHVKPLISVTFPFNMSVEAFIRAAEHRPNDIKIQINEIN
jgi:D-xylulose reductase|tara:strand:+ start:7077 stop:7226 length:150 start_codon:yes stop_codon:yes gene_type:complete